VGGLDAVGYAELMQHVRHMNGRGTRADVQARGDLAVGQAGGQRLKHIPFAASQRLQRRGDGWAFLQLRAGLRSILA
jgi:hypothetical protein